MTLQGDQKGWITNLGATPGPSLKKKKPIRHRFEQGPVKTRLKQLHRSFNSLRESDATW